MSSSQRTRDNHVFSLNGHRHPPSSSDNTNITDITNQTSSSNSPVFICVLGHFRLFKNGHLVTRHGHKAEVLLASLALQPDYCLPRDVLIRILWPEHVARHDHAHHNHHDHHDDYHSDSGNGGSGKYGKGNNGSDDDNTLIARSFNSLIHNLKELLADAMNGVSPILHSDGMYRLNVEAGIGVDLTFFERIADIGDQHYNRGKRTGNYASAINHYTHAANLYKGDPCMRAIPHTVVDVQTKVRCERIRERYLTLLGRLAEHHYAHHDYDACIETSFRLLQSEPFREDIHRMMMRCYVKMGQRSGAMRQYRFCEELLQAYLNMKPEPDTTVLYEQVLHDPQSV